VPELEQYSGDDHHGGSNNVASQRFAIVFVALCLAAGFLGFVGLGFAAGFLGFLAL